MEAASEIPTAPITEEAKPMKRRFSLPRFKIFGKKRNQEAVAVEREAKGLSLEEAAEEMVDLLEEKNEFVIIRLKKRKTILTVGILLLLLWLGFVAVKMGLVKLSL